MFIDGISCHFTYEGTIEDVQLYIPVAQNMLRRMRAMNLRDQMQQIGDGVQIHVKLISPTIGSIHIRASGCKFVSGLFDIVLPPKPLLPIDPTWDLVKADGTPYKVVNQLYPRTETKGTSTYGPWKSSELLAKNWTSDESSGANSFLNKIPGHYTGQMRKVVQLLIGQGKPVPYEHTWMISHGLFVSSKDTRWIIEISATKGVRAWKAPICREVTKGDPGTIDGEIATDLGFVPRYVKYETQSNNAIVLLTAAQMADFYVDRMPMFLRCGWAFNYSGSIAQNTCWRWDYDLGGYKRSYRYSVNVVEDLDGKPKSATLVKEEEGVVHGDRLNCFKIPDDNLGLVDFDLYYFRTAPSAAINGPLYVFYNTSNEPVIVRMEEGTPATSSVFVHGNPVGLSPTPVTSEDAGWVDVEGTKSKSTVPIVTGGHPHQESISGNYNILNLTHSDRNGFFTSVSGGSDPRQLINDEFRQGSGDYHVWFGGQRKFYNSVVVPFHDRESVYSVQFTGDVDAVYVTDYTITEGHYTRGTNIACLQFESSACAPGYTGYKYSASFATDSRVGFYNATWSMAQFARELPFLPSGEGQTACVRTDAYLGDNSYAYGVTVNNPLRVTIDYRLITSSDTISTSNKSYTDASYLSSPYYKPFEFLDGTNFHFMAAYRSAFGDNRVYAYKAPDIHTDLYSNAIPYPNIEGSVIPTLFVGKP